MDAHELIRQLQVVLDLRVRTGQISLNPKEGRLESFETHVYARLKPQEKNVDKGTRPSAH